MREPSPWRRAFDNSHYVKTWGYVTAKYGPSIFGQDKFFWQVQWVQRNDLESRQVLSGTATSEARAKETAELILIGLATRETTLWPPDGAEEDAHD